MNPPAGEYPITDSKRLAVHLIDQALAALPQDGEQIVGVFDLRDFDFGRNADFGFAKFMVRRIRDGAFATMKMLLAADGHKYYPRTAICMCAALAP